MPSMNFRIQKAAPMHGAPTYDAYSELVRGRLGTVVIHSYRSTFLPAINKHYWPEQIETADIIKAAEAMHAAPQGDLSEEHHEVSPEHPGALSNLPHDA